ncbi:MAG: ion channel [Paracoccaceae bacterium]
MAMHSQIFWGSFYLTICCLMHVGFLAMTINVLEKIDHGQERPGFFWVVLLLMASFVSIALSHTVQVWLWAWALIGIENLQDWNSSVYFSLVSYTSLGYGDVTLGPGARIFGAFSSVTGLLTFGLSTAFLVALMTRLLKGWFH